MLECAGCGTQQAAGRCPESNPSWPSESLTLRRQSVGRGDHQLIIGVLASQRFYVASCSIFQPPASQPPSWGEIPCAYWSVFWLLQHQHGLVLRALFGKCDEDILGFQRTHHALAHTLQFLVDIDVGFPRMMLSSEMSTQSHVSASSSPMRREHANATFIQSFSRSSLQQSMALKSVCASQMSRFLLSSLGMVA